MIERRGTSVDSGNRKEADETALTKERIGQIIGAVHGFGRLPVSQDRQTLRPTSWVEVPLGIGLCKHSKLLERPRPHSLRSAFVWSSASED